jgi:predicted DCC family thiol-disulfide oxidoreductase YuxK
VFFDGHCGLCNSSVDWILKHDKDHVFRFSPLQGETAGNLFAGVTEEELYRSFWLKDADGLHRRSTAILRVCRSLRWPIRWLYGLIVVPLPMRDWVYNLIAKNRYRIWGRSETCRIPSQEERAFFLP